MSQLKGKTTTDYAGFAGLIDVNTYRRFISEDWEFQELEKRLLEEMRRATIIPWTTPEGQIWIRVQTHDTEDSPGYKPSHFQRFKVTGPVVFSCHSGGLTNCAQFEDQSLPFTDDYYPQSNDVLIEVEPGDYLARLDQMFPYDGMDQFAPKGCGRKEYLVTLCPYEGQHLSTSDIPFAKRSESGRSGD